MDMLTYIYDVIKPFRYNKKNIPPTKSSQQSNTSGTAVFFYTDGQTKSRTQCKVIDMFMDKLGAEFIDTRQNN